MPTAGKVTFTEGDAPGTPDSGTVGLYAKTDGKLYIKDDTGTETDLTATGGGGSSLPVDDTTSLVQDPADNTKQARLDVGGVTASNTRVLTVPDADLTIVGTDTAQTLTNKTIIPVKVQVPTITELTISTGSITITQLHHSIDTELDTATDDLDTISGGVTGDILYVQAANDARTVVLKNGTGNILTYSGSDISLDEDHKIINLIYDGTNWREVSDSSSSSGGGSFSGASTTYEVNESSDYTTTSTTFVDVDATNLSLTITTTGGNVLVGFSGTARIDTTGAHIHLNLDVDGSAVATDDGLVSMRSTGVTINPMSFTHLVTGLSAGSHTFKLQWKVSSSTATLYAGAGTTHNDIHPQFWVQEFS
ncbi:MAG: hypothetical protein ACPG7F_00950 [Aggregatilineales bacterium]